MKFFTTMDLFGKKMNYLILGVALIGGIVIFWFVNHQLADKHIQAQEDQLHAQAYEQASQAYQLEVQAAQIEIQAYQQSEQTYQRAAAQQVTAQQALELQGLAQAVQLQIQAAQTEIQAYQQDSQADQLQKQAYLQAAHQEH